MVAGKVTRFCARCGTPIVLVRMHNQETGRSRVYTDQTTRFHLGRLFLCSEECLASIVKQFGAVEAFEEWALSPASLVGAHGTGRGE